MIFKVIPSFPSFEVSDTGVVRNVETKHIKSQRIGTTPYYVVSLHSKKTHKTVCRKVHVLMREAFMNNQDPNLVVNHIDGNKLNNLLSNLELVTQKQNILHAMENGFMDNKGKNNGMAILDDEKVREIKLLLKQGIYQRTIAEKFGVSRSCILSINLGKTWSYINV
jgi:hypothetical protein